MSSNERGFGAVLRNRHFLFLWVAQAVSQTAQNGANLVQIVLIETLTHSSGQVALMILAFTLPAAVLSVVAGVVVDRVSNRLILFASNALRVVFTLGYLAAFHGLRDWPALAAIYLLTFGSSAIGQFFAPAETATIPALVERDSLFSANALFNLTTTAAQLIGLVVLFPLVLKVGNTLAPNRGIDIAFVLIATMYLVATLLVALLPQDRRPYHPEPVGPWGQTLRDVREGWRFVRSNPPIYLPMMHLTMVAMLVMVLVTIGPGFATRVLGFEPEDAIYIFGPAGVGMLIGTVLMGRYGQHFQRDDLSSTGEITVSFALVGLAGVGWASQSPSIGRILVGLNDTPMVMALSVVLGFSLALIAIPAQTSLQERSPIDLRGRVFALLYTMSSLVVIVPLIFIGALADWVGIPIVSLLVATLAFIAGCIGFYVSRKLIQFGKTELVE
ncbi:MAG: MFS transporter [Chloroflexi bacterium]|nr:MFS transporter [Chloroflexota bacterium]